MPSTIAQAAGFGYGPGHHAPMVRAPHHRTPPAPRVTVVPPGVQPFCPQAYRNIAGCGGDCGAGGCPGWMRPGPYAPPMIYGPALSPAAPGPEWPQVEAEPIAPGPSPQPAEPQLEAPPAPGSGGERGPEPLPMPSDRQAQRPRW